MTRIGRIALVLSVAVALTMATMHAGPKDQLVILEATIAGDTITVTGMNFGGGTLVVNLGGDPPIMFVVDPGSLTETHFEATATSSLAGLPSGTYKLSIMRAGSGGGKKGKKKSQRSLGTFDVTLGAVGPTGANGADGADGADGATGPPGSDATVNLASILAALDIAEEDLADLLRSISTGDHRWSQRFGDTGADSGFGLATDLSGNVVVIGHFTRTVDFGGGPLTSAGFEDVFLAKYGADGTHLWSQRFGNTGHETGSGVATDADGNVFVTYSFQTMVNFGGGALDSTGSASIFLAKYDADGIHLWSHSFGGAGFDEGTAVATDASGNVVVTGFFRGTANFGGGPLVSASSVDVFLAKYDADGAHVWSRRFGGTERDEGLGVATDVDGNVVVTGYFGGMADFGDGVLTSAGDDEVFLAKYAAADGAHLWSQRFGGGDTDAGYSVATDLSGNVVVTGTFRETVDFGGGPLTTAGGVGRDVFLAKYDADGMHLWSQRFGGGRA